MEPPIPGGCPHYIEVGRIGASTMKSPARRQAGRGSLGVVRTELVAFFELSINDVVVAFTGLVGAGS